MKADDLTMKINKIKNENDRLEKKIREIHIENENLVNKLNTLKKTRFFRLWQKWCRFKDLFANEA